MKLENMPFSFIQWDKIPVEKHPGEEGFALWKTCRVGEVRVRIVEYSPNYKADHWCHKGHILYVLEGEMLTELEDGRVFQLQAGTGYHVADNTAAHRSISISGARLMIVD